MYTPIPRTIPNLNGVQNAKWTSIIKQFSNHWSKQMITFVDEDICNMKQFISDNAGTIEEPLRIKLNTILRDMRNEIWANPYSVRRDAPVE